MIEDATKSKEADLDAHCQLGEVQLKSGELAKAFDSFQKALQINSNSFKAIYGLGKVQHQRKIFVSVGRLYAKAKTLAGTPEDLKEVEFSLRQFGKDLITNALETLERGDLNQAADQFINIIFALPAETCDPIDLEAAQKAFKETLPQRLILRAQQLLKEEQPSEALYLCRKAFQINPEVEEARELINHIPSKIIQNESHPITDGQTPKNFQRVLLDDLKNISEADFKKAKEQIASISNLINDRKSFIERDEVSISIALPDGMWKNRKESIVFTGEYDLLNHLRIHSSFTGNKLAHYLDPSNFKIPELLKNKYFELTKDLPEELIARPPKMLGELGWYINGGIFNQDIAAYQERLLLLHKSGIIEKLNARKTLNILEIGSGYGGLAYFIKAIFPQSTIFLCDLPESLIFPYLYLSLTLPQHQHKLMKDRPSELDQSKSGFIYLPNYMFQHLQDTHFDLVINTLSFSEMTKEQVTEYSRGIKGMIGSKGYFFEQNQDNRPIGNINAQDIISEVFEKKLFSEKRSQGTANVWVK